MTDDHKETERQERAKDEDCARHAGDDAKPVITRRTFFSSVGAAGAAFVAASVYGLGSGTDHSLKPKDLMALHYCVTVSIADIRNDDAPDPGFVYFVTDRGQEGPFVCDPTDTVTPDNTGLVLVANSGMRLKRAYEGEISVRWFGAKGDGQTDDTAAIQAAIRACAERGGTVYFPAGRYICTATLVVPSGVVLRGAGLDEWVPSAQNIKKLDGKGTHLIFKGTGPKVHTVYGITNMRMSGGVRSNPDVSGQEYKLTNFYREDAAGSNPATPEPFSVAVLVEDAVQCGISQLRITHHFNGIEGFNSATDPGLGDAWDVGLWLKNASQGRYDLVQVVGYWRKYGVLISSMNDPRYPDRVPTAESNRFVQCVASGKVGMGIRSGDVYRCLSVASDSVGIAWSSSNPFPSTGGVFRVGSDSYTYGRANRIDDATLRLEGVSPNPVSGGIKAGSEIRTSASNFGFAGTVISDCYIAGFDHSSGVVCTNGGLSAPFDSPSACLEISGEPVRGIIFMNCTIQTREDVLLHCHDARDIEFIACYFEAKSARSALRSGFDLPAGARFIASPFIGKSTAPFPSGETNDIQFVRCTGTDSVICRQPLFKRTGASRFGAESGLFTPRGFVDDSLINGRIDGTYPISLPKATPVTIYDYNGNKIGMIGYNETGELDLRSASGNLRLRNDSVTRMLLSPSDITVYGTTRPNADNALSLGTSSSRWKDIYAATGTVNTSDAREKERIEPMAAALELIERLRPVAFKFKDYQETVKDETGKERLIEHRFDRTHFGLIAQEVKSAFDALGMDAGAYVYDRETDRHGLRYTEFVPVLIQAVQELSREVKRLSDAAPRG
ncbi:glycosyl hydrolase family 28-related protein [Paenibacillus allorhizosphaerae]|uniref:Peptidase S74 domain-containing protein n=1 Tax=Paenibacillus allorhizosphaerae TaxID=2849866 RepID=A0ABM8VSD6_9BACL|nr:glycosyl hydrolase family 28-related protein [Paenibacillus allorhizosphaerae]CAG7656451.1 hypothetical protein PAECIP111802_06405 [Paenibacillus allorhizosphaerae]